MRIYASASISTDGWLRAESKPPSIEGTQWTVLVRGAEKYGEHVFVVCADEGEARALADAINAVYARREAREAA